jgi:5-methylcytosine-specific restriction endonuclease McrA
MHDPCFFGVKMPEHQPCLILNQDYTPLTSINWKRAICLEIIGNEIIGEGVTVIEYYEDFIKSGSGKLFKVPAVAVSNRYVKRKRKVPLKKRNLVIRDKACCQYCGLRLSKTSATVDHIKPKSHFKDSSLANTWENTVIACNKCNSYKDNRTPEQAGMKLLTTPKEPDGRYFYKGISPWYNLPEEWKNYVRT